MHEYLAEARCTHMFAELIALNKRQINKKKKMLSFGEIKYLFLVIVANTETEIFSLTYFSLVESMQKIGF